MSEYQFVAFRAIDTPVSAKNLEYMQRQSSRAEITKWSFENEYHYGDFGGNALEMLRRGYDIHLHYASYGVRKLLIRLPNGFPDPTAAKPYLAREGVEFKKDKSGSGGALVIEPYDDSGRLDQLWDLGEWLERLAPLRTEILNGDLRPLYLAHLIMASDDNHDPDETVEAPVPFGLGEPTEAQLALLEFYEIERSLLAAAAHEIPAAPVADDLRPRYAEWIAAQAEATKNDWLATLMADADSSVRLELLTAFAKELTQPSWPTVRRGWTIAELDVAAEQIGRELAAKKTAAAKQARERKLAKMAHDPSPILKQTEDLVVEQTSQAYKQAGSLLAELREALAGGDRAGLADEQALRLHQKHPQLHRLTAALRSKGFIPKKTASKNR